MSELYMAKADLQHKYNREYALLCDDLDNIMSYILIVKERLARMELLKELQKEK